MNDEKFELDQSAQAVADQMLATARAERKTRESAKRFVGLLKLIAAGLLIGTILWLVKPFILGNEIRDRQRQDNVRAIVDEINSYKSAHRNSLPMANSRRQWEREFIDVYLKDKSFVKDPKSGESYSFEINRKKSSADLSQELDYVTVHIDQSATCADNGEITDAANAVAAVRLKLESGQVYCVDTD